MTELTTPETRGEVVTDLTEAVTDTVTTFIQIVRSYEGHTTFTRRDRYTLLESYHNYFSTELVSKIVSHISINRFEVVETEGIINKQPVITINPKALKNLIPEVTMYPFDENSDRFYVLLGAHKATSKGRKLTYEVPFAFRRCFGQDDNIYIFGVKVVLHFKQGVKREGVPYDFVDAHLEFGLIEVEPPKSEPRLGLVRAAIGKAFPSRKPLPTSLGEFQDLGLGIIILEQETLKDEALIREAIEERMKDAFAAIESRFLERT